MTIDSSRKENLTPAGIQTTTLKEIEKKDPFQKQVHDADLFDNSKKPADRFLDIPKYVPFAFAVGGGLLVLDSLEQNEAQWRAIDWSGDPPLEYDVGSIYFKNSGCVPHVKIAENNQGGWVWQKLEEEEKPSFRTGQDGWEYKIYFGPEYRKSVELNNSLNLDGWGRSSVFEDENFPIPETLECCGLDIDYLGDRARRNFLVFDPERAEVCRIKSKDLDEQKETDLAENSWEFVDSNIARAVYVRTKK